MTNKNVCIGMVKTDIVVEKSPLILIRDEQYEIVSLESEGKLNTDNYSFKVTSRSQPPRFYGWVPFKDTKVLGPLVDHRLIWWDAVIPRGKATNTRTPLCIILYCRPDLLNTIAKYFESQGLFLKTPPFYNPACRYSNPHHHLLEQHYNHHYSHQQQQQYRYQQQHHHHYHHHNHHQQGPYNGLNQQHYGQSNGSNERQSQKDIELLLASIPSDVPQILLKKKKKSNSKKKSKNPIIILSDEEDEDETRETQDSVEKEKEQEEEHQEEIKEESEDELDHGYVEGLRCHLMDHQIKGVSWMIDRENNKSSNGGILADNMGLGKTIQTIALMASTMTSESDDEDEDEQEERTEEEEEDHKITLIVTPLALIHQWVDEIITKTEKGKLRVLKHHGPNRTKNYATFKRYDVVVTTYQVVASDMPSTNTDKKRKKKSIVDDFIVKDDEDDEEEGGGEKKSIPKHYTPLKKNHGPLFQLKWHRVVLDEAQFIKNRTTKASLSCATLSAVKRWCLTGTPIQNNVDELYSLLRFLRIQPLCDYQTFKKHISIPIMNNETHIAMNRLKAVLMAVMLRRTKSVLGKTNTTEDANGEKIENNNTTSSGSSSPKNDESLSKRLTLKLPSRQKTDILLHFTKNERALYQLLMTKSKDTIQSMVGNQNRYMNMLCLLLRLRQACDHPQLILKTIDNDKDILDIVSDTNSNDNNWQNICDLCGSPKKDFGEQNKPYCFDCMQVLESNAIDKERSLFQTSTKIRKVLEILNQTRESNPGEKTIIFSQFTSMLDLIEGPLKRDGFKVCRYDGSMSSQLRERSLSLLKHDSKTTVMLISLKCGSLGLNLTAANRVILVDIWWNPALEEQAIDRVHRIGQTLPVHVTRLLVENTVELKIVELQEKKAQLSKGALGDGLVKNAKLSVSEIRSLFDL
ncbi:SNF2 family N-terminal domain-containing protein [Pilaira anomala]|nr:SNF2 family N-terminal domain-containing protein [Pilaira anomala]